MWTLLNIVKSPHAEMGPSWATIDSGVNIHLPSASSRLASSERPGRFSPPLLATLITGAAPLLLALAEHLAQRAGTRLVAFRHQWRAARVPTSS